MNQLYSVPAVINGKLEHMQIMYKPTVVDFGKRDYVELPALLCVVREAKRQLASDGHDNATIKINGIAPCVLK